MIFVYKRKKLTSRRSENNVNHQLFSVQGRKSNFRFRTKFFSIPANKLGSKGARYCFVFRKNFLGFL